MSVQYTPDDIYKKLLDQGYTHDRAKAVASSIGPIDRQDSNIVPNLAEGAAFMAATPLVNNKISGTGKLAKFGRFALPSVAANLAGIGVSGLTNNNFYENASLPQLAGDIGGQIAFGVLGERLGKGTAKGLGKTAEKKLAETAAGKLLGKAIGGRAIGGTVGSLLGPAGTLIGSTLGGYILPKFFANENEKFLEPDKGIDSSTLAALGAGSMLLSPLARPVRKLISDNTKWAEPLTKYPKRYAEAAKDMFVDPLAAKAMNNTALRAGRQGYQADLMDRKNKILSKYDQAPDPNKFGSTGYNARETLAGIQALNGGFGDFGQALASTYKKRKQQQ